MSYNGAGTFLVNSAGQPVVAGTTISETVFNALTADLATGLSTAITKDGQTTATANLPMGGFKLTNLGAGTASTDSARLGQVQSGAATLIAITGTDTVVGTLTPTLTAYAAGQQFSFVAAATNTTPMTLNIDGLGAKAITRSGATALIAGDITVGKMITVIYDGTQFQTSDARVPISTGVSGLGTGVATALGVAVTGSGSVVLSASPTLTGTMTAAQATFPGDVAITGAQLVVTNTGVSGANLRLTGDGATTPNKTMRVLGGVFQIINSAYTAVILSLTDAGVLTLADPLPVASGGTGVTSSTGTGSAVLSASPTLTGTMTAAQANFTGAVTAPNSNLCTQSNAKDLALASGTSAPTGVSLNVYTLAGTLYGIYADQTSDERLKFDIRPTPIDALETLKNIEVCSYSLHPQIAAWFASEGKDNDTSAQLAQDAEPVAVPIGFIAQQLQQHVPDAVRVLEQTPGISPLPTDLHTLNLPALMPYLVRAIQQQQAEIAQLRADLSTLTAQVA